MHLPRRLLAADGPSRRWEQPLFVCTSRGRDLWEGTGEGGGGGRFCLPRGNSVGPRACFCAGGSALGMNAPRWGCSVGPGAEPASRRGAGCAGSPAPLCAMLWGLTGTCYLRGPAGVCKSCLGSRQSQTIPEPLSSRDCVRRRCSQQFLGFLGEGCFLGPLALDCGAERMRAGVPFSSGLREAVPVN